MGFRDYKQVSKQYGVTGDYFKLQPGENPMRILTDPEPIFSHFHQDGPVTCPGELTCPECKAGGRKTSKIMLYIVDRADDEVKLAELGWSVYKAIGELANSKDWGFEKLPHYDIIVNRSGEGKETRYTVTPSRNEKPITEEQKIDLAKKKPIKEIILNRIKKSQQGESSAELEQEFGDDLPFD